MLFRAKDTCHGPRNTSRLACCKGTGNAGFEIAAEPGTEESRGADTLTRSDSRRTTGRCSVKRSRGRGCGKATRRTCFVAGSCRDCRRGFPICADCPELLVSLCRGVCSRSTITTNNADATTVASRNATTNPFRRPPKGADRPGNFALCANSGAPVAQGLITSYRRSCNRASCVLTGSQQSRWYSSKHGEAWPCPDSWGNPRN